jgi:hypothetical protein
VARAGRAALSAAVIALVAGGARGRDDVGAGDRPSRAVRTRPDATPSRSLAVEAPAASSGVVTREPPHAPSLARHALYVEGLGPTLFWSMNYELRAIDAMSVRVGFSAFPTRWLTGVNEQGVAETAYAGVFMLSWLGGDGDDRLELGMGAVTLMSTGMPALTVGIRHHPAEGGVVFRLALTPVLSPAIQFAPLRVPFGVSLGGAF